MVWGLLYLRAQLDLVNMDNQWMRNNGLTSRMHKLGF